ncbi:MAG TPA: DUF2127 domain-containing protein [Bryobacteraceae bacterium]|nr:DUF2127 domain-containing protein [Bryobacteraceae bacterium]
MGQVKGQPQTPTPQTNPFTSRGNRIVAVYEGLKGVLVLLAAFGLLSLVHKDVEDVAETLLGRLHVREDGRLYGVILNAASKVTDTNLWMIASAAMFYSGVRFIEAYGLWKQRTWAQWFGLLSGLLYLPWELAALIKHPSALHLAIILINVAIVGYFAWALRKSR